MAATSQSRWRSIGAWLPFLLVAFGPVLVLVWCSLHPGDEGFSLRVYRDALLDRKRLELLGNSLLVGGGAAALSLLVGVPVGFLLGRSDLRGRSVYGALIMVPLLIPPYITGIAWTQVVLFGGYDAIVLLLASAYFPIVALLAARGFRDVDREAEDAARLLMGPARAFARVTLPLARPSLVTGALLVFVLAISDFTVPDFFSFAGAQEGSFQVFATDVYFRWATDTDPESATAAALPLLVLAALGGLLIARLESARLHTSRGGAFREPQPFALGRFAPLAHLGLLAVLGLSAGVPLGVLTRWMTREIPLPAGSAPPANPAPGAASAAAPTGGEAPTLRDLLQGEAGADLVRALGYSAAGAVLLLLLALGPARQLARQRVARPLLLGLVVMPLAFPSLLVGMAQLQLFNHPGSWLDPFYAGGGLVVWTLAVRFLPLGILGLRAFWVRIEPQLEEAAALAVPGVVTRWRRVIVPLLGPGLWATGILCFALALRDLDLVVLLDGAQKTLPLRIYNKVHYARDSEVARLCLIQLAAIFVPWVVVRLLLPRARR